jgi:hypothetical protein
MCSIEAKLVKFGHPNKLILTKIEGILRETLKGWAIYLPTFVVCLSIRILNFKANA